MGRNLVETLMGAGVIVVAILFVGFTYSTAGLGTIEGYKLVAKFDRVDGLLAGSDVRMNGIEVGTITDQRLDSETYLAVVTMTIDSAVKVPTDSSAQISSDGLLGDKYLSLTAGAEDAMLNPGGTIEHTQDSVDIVSQVGRMIFSQTGDEKKEGAAKEGVK